MVVCGMNDGTELDEVHLNHTGALIAMVFESPDRWHVSESANAEREQEGGVRDTRR